MRMIACTTALLLLAQLPARAIDTQALVTALRHGGHVVIFRHGATDDSQKDVYPMDFGDMKGQRQLSPKGRAMAAEVGRAIGRLGIPIGVVFTSKLNRAVETGQLLSGKDVEAVAALTDSGAGVTSAMANPSGANELAGLAVRLLVNTPPKAGTNTILVTHKTNFADAFGKDAGDVQEGEAFVFKPDAAAELKLMARIKPADWLAATAN